MRIDLDCIQYLFWLDKIAFEYILLFVYFEDNGTL